MIRIGTATITYYPEGAFTTYEDGTSYAAQPHNTPHYDEIARRCGYGLPDGPHPHSRRDRDEASRLAYCRKHEVCHHIVSEWIGGHTSRVLWPLAHGREPVPYEAIAEEALAITFQRWLRANERPMIGDVDWDELKARALTLLDA